MLCRAVLKCAVLCCAVLNCAVLCRAVLSCAVLCRAVLHCAVLCGAVLICALPCRAVVNGAVLCRAVLHCAVLCCAGDLRERPACSWGHESLVARLVLISWAQVRRTLWDTVCGAKTNASWTTITHLIVTRAFHVTWTQSTNT